MFFGVVTQMWALECVDVDTAMLNSFDEESVCSVSLLQHRAEPKRKSRTELSSIYASEDASFAVQELSDAIGKLTSVETASKARGLHGNDKDESKVKKEAQKEAFHAMKAMKGAFAELFSQHPDHTNQQSAKTGHKSHRKGVALTQMSASESNPPPLVFSWEGSPLTSDFEDAKVNQTSNATVKLAAKINESSTEAKQSPSAGEEKPHSNVSSDTPFMNDTVYVEASSLAVANATPQADAVASTNGTLKVSNSTVFVANQTTTADNDAVAKKGVATAVNNLTIGTNVSTEGTAEDVGSSAEADQRKEAADESKAGSNQSVDSNATVDEAVNATGAIKNTTSAVNQTAELNSDDAPMPVFVFNGTKLAEDIDEVVGGATKLNVSDAPAIPKSSLLIDTDMDKVGMKMDHLINSVGENLGVDGSVAGLAQVDHKFHKLSSRAEGEMETSSRALSEMSASLTSLQVALAKMDAAELAL